MSDSTRMSGPCSLYTSDAADDPLCVDLGGSRLIKKQNESVTPTLLDEAGAGFVGQSVHRLLIGPARGLFLLGVGDGLQVALHRVGSDDERRNGLAADAQATDLRLDRRGGRIDPVVGLVAQPAIAAGRRAGLGRGGGAPAEPLGPGALAACIGGLSGHRRDQRRHHHPRARDPHHEFAIHLAHAPTDRARGFLGGDMGPCG